MIRTLLKSLSRTVHHEELDHQEHFQEYCEEDDSGNSNSNSPWKSLTVWRKSLCVGCNGFTVIDSYGNLVFRVDNYIDRGHPNHHILLMDALGNPILTLSRRKQKLGLVDKWLVYEGEGGGGDYSTTKTLSKPIYCARKHINILQHNHENTLARVCHGGTYGTSTLRYVIEGSYGHRSCKVLDESGRVAAEIRKKEDVMEGISFGLDVFVLVVRPGFSPAFAMGIVLLLDQMFS